MKNVLTAAARKLRNNPTDAEQHLWSVIRRKHLGVKFRRQAVIGRFIVDFVCFERKLAIEVDGGQHAQNPEDRSRDAWLKKEGFHVLRFWNHEVLQHREGVVQKITEGLSSPALNLPLPDPPHKGEGKRFLRIAEVKKGESE